MKTIKTLFAFTALFGLLTFSACQPDEPEENPYSELEFINSANSDNIEIEVYAQEALYAGYNTLYFKVLKDQAETKNAMVSMKPVMYMPEKTHSCPTEQPSLNDNDLFEGHVLFQMPSMNGYWELVVNITLDEGKNKEFTLPIEVIQPEFARALVTTSTEGQRLIIGYVSPLSPMVGANDFEVAIYTVETMMSFPPVTGLNLEIEPEMPSMGHGSEGNLNPVEMENGHYKGTVAFNMMGDWRIHLDILKNNEVVKDGLYFDLFFQQ